MNSIELGKKIKEARISKKMTQNEVVGTFITRNMLSQIENGTATPSVKTLQYLSSKLDVSFSDFMPEQKDDSLYQLELVKNVYREKNYAQVLEFESKVPEVFTDEFYALFSYAYLEKAKELFQSNQYAKAAEFAQKSIHYASSGIYSNSTIQSEAIMILHQAAQKV